MARESTPSLFAQYWRLLGGLALVVGASSATMVLAAGGSATDAVLIGGVGLVIGVGVAAYLYHLLGQLRRRP